VQRRRCNRLPSEFHVDVSVVRRIVCMTANETHRNGQLLGGMAESLATLLAMYQGAHPDQALQLERMAKLEAELRRC
jgi:hypothetical protein